MKRIISLIMVVMLLIGIMPASMAATKTAGEELRDLGLLTGDTEGNLMEDKYLTRSEMMVILARMLGEFDEAENYMRKSTFTDGNNHWAERYVAYAQMRGWTSGMGNNEFGYEMKHTAQQAAVFMLKTLGYIADTDFTWTTAFQKATQLDLFDDVDVEPSEDIIRGDLFRVMMRTLNTEMKGETKTLGETLGIMGTVPLKVQSVVANGLLQVIVEYNNTSWADADELIVKDNYIFEDQDGNALLDVNDDPVEIADIKVKDKVVTITFEEPVEQQSEANLTVSDKILPVEADFDFVFFDTKPPVAVSAAAVGKQTLKVTFSEPVNSDTVSSSDFTVDNGDMFIKDVTMMNNNTEANIELYAELEAGTLKVTVGSGIEDYAGFKTSSKTFDVRVVVDTTAPSVVGYKDATTTGVTLIFNEDIVLTDDYRANASIYHTNTSNLAAPISDDDINGKELKLDFSANKMPEGNAYLYILADTFMDLWDNENSKQTLLVRVSVDDVKPTLLGISVVSEDEIELTFSEAVDESTAEDLDNYTLQNSSGSSMNDMIDRAVRGSGEDTDKVTIIFEEALLGNYKLVVENVEDLAGNEISKVTRNFTVTDLTAPVASSFSAKLYNPDADVQTLVVRFGEAMATSGKYAVNDLEKYVLEDTKFLSELDDVTISMIESNKAVEIKIPKSSLDLEEGENYRLQIGRIADAAGNYTVVMVNTLYVKDAGSVLVEEAKLISSTRVEVTFEDRLVSINNNDFVVYSDANGNNKYDTAEKLTVTRVSSGINSDGNTVLTLTLSAKVGTDAKSVTGNHDIAFAVISQNSKNQYNEVVEKYDNELIDAASPEVEEVYFIDSDEILVVMTEELEDATFAPSGKNGFTTTSGTLLTATSYGDRSVLLKSSENDFTINTNVYYNEAAEISDLEGNILKSFSRTNVLVQGSL